MDSKLTYKTKQKDAILSYVIKMSDQHITVSQIYEYFQTQSHPIGLATIYRYLDKLVACGKVKKYTLNGSSGACYQYMGLESCHLHYHLKCERCGALVHINCSILDELHTHVLASHHFHIDIGKTVFYGTCSSCNQEKP